MSQTFATISVASHQHACYTQPKACAKLAPDQLKERQDATAVCQTTIDDAMAKWWSDSMALADDLAQRFKMKPKYFHELRFQGGAHMIHHQTKVNPYNVFKAEKATECRANGESKNTCELHKDYFEEYRQMTDEEKDALVEHHKDVGVRKIRLRRDTPRAKVQDVANIVRNMQLLLIGLNQRVGVEGFFCIYMTIATRGRWHTRDVGTKLEAFAIAGCDVVNLLCTSKQKADHLKMLIHDQVRDKLIEATGDRNAQMQYSNYKEGIVHRYGVKLVGWTFPVLHDTCKWEKLNLSQLTERIAKHNADIAAGVVPARVREPRSDAGVKRPRAIRDENAPDDDVDSGDEGSTEVRVGPAPPPKKCRVAKKAAIPVLPDEDEDDEVREPHEALPSTQPLRSRKKTTNGGASAAATKAIKTP
ncbi:hypothetical protein DFH09DRAFT_1331933 [Mycena vulgaris]|nr:hypothetical protein DFH09DRAFT_1331933 [Mycena vulgaris]